MPRPVTKEALKNLATEQYTKLWSLIDSFSLEEQEGTFPFDDRDKNIKDVLIHLYEWHELLLNWINNNQNGVEKAFLPEPYNWKTYGIMNIEMIWKKHQNTLYQTSRNLLEESHKKVMSLLESYTDEELFTKKYFSWTGSTTLGSYFISTTSSHYDWAMKKIKKYQKEIGAK